MTTAIAVAGLRKSYGEQLVLDGIDLAVQQGTVVALLGPNGAGKTTTVQILPTLIHSGGMQRKLVAAVTGPLAGKLTGAENCDTKAAQRCYPSRHPSPRPGLLRTAGTAGCHGAGN